MNDQNYKIVNLYSENIKRIKAVDITPSDDVVIIEGKNMQGKTSVLDSIAYALGGKRLIPNNPVRNGEDSAVVVVDIGDYKITRKWTANDKSSLIVENKDGNKQANAQTFLDGLIGNLSFDPLEFLNMNKSERISLIKNITGLNFDKLDEEYEDLYNERRFITRELKNLEAEYKQYENLPNMKKCRTLDVAQKEWEKNNKFNIELRENKKEMEELKNLNIELSLEVKNIVEQIENNKKIISEIKTKIKGKREKNLDKLEKEIAEIKKTSDLQYKISQKENLEKVIDIHKKELEDMKQEFSYIKNKKIEMIKNAKMPIEGLEIDDNDILYNGIEFEQISNAQQIEVSMSIAIAENSKLKIARIMNGSLLDKNSLENIKKIAKKNDFQVWIERVSENKTGNTIYIEDGEVKGG